MYLPPPATRDGVRIVTLIDFVGPMTAHDVSEALDIPIEAALYLLSQLIIAGYIKYNAGGALITTRGWVPDHEVFAHRFP